MRDFKRSVAERWAIAAGAGLAAVVTLVVGMPCSGWTAEKKSSTAAKEPCVPSAPAVLESAPGGRDISAALAALAGPPLVPTPTSFTRKGHKVNEGAIYDENGNPLCILKDDTNAYLYSYDFALNEELIKERHLPGSKDDQPPSRALCEKMIKKSKKLAVDNGDFLNRLLWTIGEGNCNPVEPVRGITFGTYYHGFAIANLRQHYSSEEDMLRKACNAGSGSDQFKNYFVTGAGNTADYFNLVLNPKKWVGATAADAAMKDEPAQKLKHCLRELLPSVTPGTPDPTGGAAFWVHTKYGCPTGEGRFGMKIRMGGDKPYAHDVSCCFRAKY